MCTELIEERRTDPGANDDLITILTQAFDDGALERSDSGGVDHRSPNGALDRRRAAHVPRAHRRGRQRDHPQRARPAASSPSPASPSRSSASIDDPALWDTAVDEIIRYVSPVLSFSRTVTEDHTLHGAELKAGEKVFMLYQSANRDEDVFDAPDELRVDRNPNPHVAFGIGTHYCLGANLARAEVRVVFEELFKRLGDIRVPDGTVPQRGASALVLSLEHLPAVFTPEPAAC